MKRLALALVFHALTLMASSQDLGEVEKAILVETNRARAQVQARNLVLDPLLSEVALGHSQEMLSSHYFAHESPNQLCRTVRDRLRFAHRFCLSSAENLHKCRGFEQNRLAKLAVDSWLASSGHRRNLLNSRFLRVGIGVAQNGDEALFTQLFSYEPVLIQDLKVVPEGSGFRVKVTAVVEDGPREGGWFVDGRRQSSWVAGADGSISVDLLMSNAGTLEIGQATGFSQFSVETSIPIPPPEKHVKHSWMDAAWPVFSLLF